MFQSAQHPFLHTPALLMWVLIAFTIASIPPAAPAFTWFSAVHFILFVVFISVLTVVSCHIEESSTPNKACISIINVNVDGLHNSLNPSCYSCLHSVLICSFHFIVFCSFHLIVHIVFTIICYAHECSTSHFTHTNIVNVCIDSIHNSLYSSCCSSLHSVLSCSFHFVVVVLYLQFLAVMFQSAAHPISHTSALLMWVLIAFTTVSINPASLYRFPKAIYKKQ